MIKAEAYRWTHSQVRAQVKRHFDTVATLANIAAILEDRFANFFWVGFYFFRSDHLALGPFQGPPACMKLSLDAGVCAASVREKRTFVVPDVHQFPGHVACDSRSKSEIVVPLFDPGGAVRAVLDVDSERLADFGDEDKQGLETLARLIAPVW